MDKKKMPIKEAKKKFIKSSFYCGVIAILVCWFMKLIGFDLFGLDLDNKFFNDMSSLFDNNYWLKQIYFAILLNIQLYLMMCAVHQGNEKNCFIYLIKLLPITIFMKVLTCVYAKELSYWAILIEFIYLTLVMSKCKIKLIFKSIGMNIFVILYQIISIITRSQQIQDSALNFVAGQILSIDLYLLLYLHKEVSKMDEGTWFFFGLTAWLYYVAGFIVGLFKLSPFKTAKEWYKKGKEKENARKTKRELKKTQKQ